MPLTRTSSAPLFGEGSYGTLRLVLYLGAAAVLMTADRHGHYLERMRSAVALAVEPLYRLAALPSDLARSASDAMADRQALREQNAKLLEDLLVTKAKLNRLGALAEQNQRLQELLDVQRALNLEVQLVKRIDVQLDPLRHFIVVDAGKNQSVQIGQAVLDARGIIGQVTETLPSTSVITLITDPKHRLPVTVERTGLRTLAYGTGALDRLELPNLPVSADIVPGDRLITSGLGGTFPAGFPVGEVKSIAVDQSGMFAAGVVRPSAALDRSGDVLLVHLLADPVGPPAPAPEHGPPRPPAAPPAAGAKQP